MGTAGTDLTTGPRVTTLLHPKQAEVSKPSKLGRNQLVLAHRRKTFPNKSCPTRMSDRRSEPHREGGITCCTRLGSIGENQMFKRALLRIWTTKRDGVQLVFNKPFDLLKDCNDMVMWLRAFNGTPGAPTIQQAGLPGGSWDGSSCFNFMREFGGPLLWSPAQRGLPGKALDTPSRIGACARSEFVCCLPAPPSARYCSQYVEPHLELDWRGQRAGRPGSRPGDRRAQF